MKDNINAIKNLLDFICSYKLTGCIKTMLFGSILIILLLLLSRGKNCSCFGRCYCLLLVFTALLVEQSKIFYIGSMFKLSNELNAVITPFLGKCYFTIMLVLLAILLMKQLWFRLYIRKHWKSIPLTEILPLSGLYVDSEQRAERGKRSFWRWYQSRILVYQRPEITAACSGGILHPYIVLPVLEEGREREQAVMLKHELTHIRHGHILWLTLVVLLRCYWWMNPLVYIWEWCFRRELECVCDELCLLDYGVEQGVYAETMLYVASQCVAGRKRHTYEAAGSCFIRGRRPFYEMRYRILSMARTSSLAMETKRIYRNNRRGYILVAGALLLLLLVCSYPRYSIMREVALYDSRLQPVFFDDKAVHRAVQISGREIVIEPEAFHELLERYQVEDEYVYLSYNQIMKVPGAGGGGEAAMVSTGDYTDITYLAADTTMTKVQRFILKWI